MPGQISWMTCSSLCTSPELGVHSFGPLKIDILPANSPGSQNSYSSASYIRLREPKFTHFVSLQSYSVHISRIYFDQ